MKRSEDMGDAGSLGVDDLIAWMKESNVWFERSRDGQELLLIPNGTTPVPADLTEAVKRHKAALLQIALRHEERTNGHNGGGAAIIPLRPARVDPDTGEVLEAARLPRIDAGNHDLPDVTRQAWAALVSANEPPRLFRFNDSVARLDVDEDGRPTPRVVSTRTLRHEVSTAAEWYVIKKHGSEPAVPPLHVTENMLEVPAPPLPLLERIAHAPYFAPDWSLVMAGGYHAGSRTYLILNDLHLAPVPDTPSRAQVQAARDLFLEELFADFPFVSDADRANALALALLPYTRPAIEGSTPLHLIEATTPGTGKGLLADVATRPAVGTHVGVMTQPQDSDEMRKRITARLREGAPVILIDNIVHTLDSGDLAGVLTADIWKDRILGVSQSTHIPVRCIWVGSGNNVTMSTELARRLIRIRLDAMIDRPWKRTGFRHANLIKWAEEHRGDLIHAALVLIQAWVAAGRPEGKVTLGSFERWAAIMGGILDNADIHGFLDNLDAFYEEADLEGAIWRQFVGLWWEQHGEKEVTVADLFPLTDTVEGLDLGKGNDKAQRIVFGKLLAKQRDRVFGDYRIVFTRVAHKQKKWRLIPTAINPLIPPDGDSEKVYPPPVFPCDTMVNEEAGDMGGCFPKPTREEISPLNRVGAEGQTLPSYPPQAIPSVDSPLPDKENPGGGCFSEYPPLPAKLVTWAESVLGDDWPDTAPPPWVVDAARECGVAEAESERVLAQAIVSAMKGEPQ